ncbi:hypothetical protein XENOCAPTIV_030646 [Xenoophorus captivus]|uniref:Uncharacterized protein n=1 Tax=Xenoophorus captivus TaxID=1517983 RepID=A0ABV0S429_9TELE
MAFNLCAVPTWFNVMTQTLCIWHPHTHTDTDAPHTAHAAGDKCLHMQDAKNSSTSTALKIDQDNKSETCLAGSKCFDSLSVCIWLFVADAGRQAEEGRR